MLGPIGSNLMSILRVLTPSEIDRYSDDVLNSAEPEVHAVAAGAENLSMSYKEHDTAPREAYKQFLGAAEEDEQKAKIIPINEEAKKELSLLDDSPDQSDQDDGENHAHNNFKTQQENSSGSSGLESIGVLSKSQLQAIEEQKQKQENDKKESTTVFILNQREKLKKSQTKLTEQAAILQYKKSASHEIIRHEIGEDDLDEEAEASSMGSCGILINKKHY